MKDLFLQQAVKVALEAGDLLSRRISNIKSISFKGRANLVTDVDKASERLIVGRLRKSFPSHAFLAEEIYTKEKQSEYKWIIDPIDGTTNYAHGFPFFAVSIALQKNNRTILGIVHDPSKGEMFTAIESKGAYLNRKRISVTKTGDLKQSLLATGFSYAMREKKDNNIDHFVKFLYKARAIRRAGSASLDLAYVACGRFDGYWEMDLKPWDTAAGAFLVQEAGGKISDFRGGAFDIHSDQTLASNGRIHKAMIDTLGYAGKPTKKHRAL